MKSFKNFIEIEEAEYKGRKVDLNDPKRASDGKKKFYVYVKNEKGNVIKNESQLFNLKLFDDQNPRGIIGISLVFAILITPSETTSFGPLGPSGVIPMYCSSRINLNNDLSE